MTWRKEWAGASGKTRTLAVVSTLAAAFLAVVGGALLASWSPLLELLSWWDAPAWTAPLAGAASVAIACLLFVDAAAFYAALVAAVGMGAAAFAWARDGSAALAIVPAVACALATAVMALRLDVPKVHIERVTRRRLIQGRAAG